MGEIITCIEELAGRCRPLLVSVLGLVLMVGIFGLALAAYQKPLPSAEAFEIVAGLIPPNLNEDGSGREADIIRTALHRGKGKAEIGNKTVRFHVEPFGEHWYSYRTDDRFDAVATVPENLDLVGHRSSFYIMYRNGVGVIGRKGAEPIERLQQLEGKRVISFAGAAQVIPGLAERVKDRSFGVYIEREDQRTHSWMLLNGQVDAVIADAMIFSEFNNRIFGEEKAAWRPIKFYSGPFMPICYVMVFRNAEYRDLFDDGLSKMIAGDPTLAEGDQLYQIDQRYMSDEIKAWGVDYLGSKGEAPCAHR